VAGNLTVRITEEFREDLDLLCGAVQNNGTILNKTAAVQYAVRLLADLYRTSWDYEDVQRGHAPDMVSYRYREEPVHTAVPGFTERNM
jgi:hypothetical protein